MLRHFRTTPGILAGFLLLTLWWSGAIAASQGEPPLAEVGAGAIRIHYQRADRAFDRWGLWLWDDVKATSNPWPSGATPFTGSDTFGGWADIELSGNPRKIGFMVIDRA